VENKYFYLMKFDKFCTTLLLLLLLFYGTCPLPKKKSLSIVLIHCDNIVAIITTMVRNDDKGTNKEQ